MASIKTHLDNIKNAILGKDVRGSIHDGIDAINKETESTTNRQVNLDATFKQLIINAGESNAEIVAGRHDNTNGTSYDSLPDRLDAASAQLAKLAKRLTHVTIDMFGAPLDGIGDDTLAMLECTAFANEYNLDIKQPYGILNLASTHIHGIPRVKTDLDLRGCKLKIDDQKEDRTLIIVESDTEPETITVTPEIQSQLIEGSISVPALKDHKFSIFTVISNKAFGRRVDSGQDLHFKQECFTIGTDGVIIDGGLLLDYTSDSLTLIKRSILDKAISINLGVISINTTDKDRLARAVHITRSNVKVSARIFVENMPEMNSSIYNFKNALIYTYGSYNVNYDNIIGENASAPTNEGDTTQGQYAIVYTLSSKNKITDCVIQRGWGVVNTQWIKDMTVRDSVINRYDNHWGMSDLLIENTKINGNNGGFLLGWGKGKVVLKDTFMDYQNKTSTVDLRTGIRLRTDLGAMYEGSIEVDGYNINIHEDLDTFSVLDGQYNTSLDLENDRQLKFPEIIMKNVIVQKLVGTQPITVFGVDLHVNGTYYENKNVKSSNITIEKLSLVNESSTRILKAIRYRNYVNNGVDVNKKFKIKLNEVGKLDRLTFNKSTALVELRDITVSPNIRAEMYVENTVGWIQPAGTFVLDIECVRYIGSLKAYESSSFFNNVVIWNKCDIQTVSQVKSIDISNSLVEDIFQSFLTVFNAKGSTLKRISGVESTVQSSVIENCTIFPLANTLNTTTLMKLNNCVLSDCIFYPVVYNNQSLPF
ncbi:hypothetical protein A499_06470, partial [Niallia nealsonii AAU1]